MCIMFVHFTFSLIQTRCSEAFYGKFDAAGAISGGNDEGELRDYVECTHINMRHKLCCARDAVSSMGFIPTAFLAL